MKRIINKAAIDKKSFNSTYVGVLSYHAIQIKEEGTYIGHVISKDQVIETIQIKCQKSCDQYQANIDFYSFGNGKTTPSEAKKLTIKPEGYLILINSRGNNPYRFQLEKVGKKPKGELLRDTKELQPGDLYACTILRPGKYQVLFNGNESGGVTVKYPTLKMDKSKLKDAMRVKLGGKGKNATVSILPMQGLVFEFENPGYVEVIQLEEEKDRRLIYKEAERTKKREKGLASKRSYKWKNPKYTTSK